MKKAILTIILSLMLILSAGAKVFIPVNSIQPVQRVNDDGININVCSSFSINKDKGYWLTANHCWDESNTFHGAKQQVIAYNVNKDLFIFAGEHVDALHLAIKAPEVGDDVHIIGYPHGSLDLVTFFGKVAAKDARVLFTTPNYHVQVFNILALPGDSGAPILDTSDRVVGIGSVSSSTGVAWNIPWKDLASDAGLKQYWEE